MYSNEQTEGRTIQEDRSEIQTRVEGAVGFLTLNRPKALNSLTHSMVKVMHAALRDWAADDDVKAVVLEGAGERGLCAGGDVVAIYYSALASGQEARQFWYDEYLLNDYISRYPKPYISLMDGIVMGGGVGVSAHGSVRVVTDASKVGMPEVGIGFYPDVGGTYLLSRAPGGLGLLAAMTGAPFSGADAIAMGFADHYVPHESLAAFTASLVDGGIDAAVARHAVAAPASKLVAQRSWIDDCFAGETVADILTSLRADGSPEASHAADIIATRSPFALSVTLEAVRRAAKLATLREALQQEYRLSCAMLSSHDLIEGVRAQLVDKDRAPKWQPQSLDDVTSSDVESFFAMNDEPLTFTESDSDELPEHIH